MLHEFACAPATSHQRNIRQSKIIGPGGKNILAHLYQLSPSESQCVSGRNKRPHATASDHIDRYLRLFQRSNNSYVSEPSCSSCTENKSHCLSFYEPSQALKIFL